MITGITSINDIPVSLLTDSLQIVKRTAKRRRKGERDFIDIVCAFDIETTTIYLDEQGQLVPSKEEGHAHAFMYHWQFQLGDDYTIIGRTWEEFDELREKLRQIAAGIMAKAKLASMPRFVVYVHNLAYEWQYLQGVYHFENDDCFFRDVRQPINCELDHVLLFRCSYLNSNMSLKKFAEKMGCKHQKLDGDEFDYSKIRYPWTELTDRELEYCVNDVRCLVEAITIEMQHDGDTLITIPSTSTGYVRRDCKAALAPIYQRSIKYILPDLETYELLQRCFRGGNTHANRYIVGEIQEDIKCVDITSSYPAVQLTKKFPMGPFRELDKNERTLSRVMQLIKVGNAVIADYHFKGIRLKDKRDPLPYIPVAKCQSLNPVEDNGRIISADMVVMALTEIDLLMILEQYDIDNIAVFNARTAIMGALPIAYREVILDYFKRKTQLKGVKGSEYEYMKSKNKLNSVYGMSAQRPVHPVIYYESGVGFHTPYLPDAETQDKQLANAPFPYQWGVYTTAYAREALWNGFKCIGKFDNGISNHCYSDTDSHKYHGTGHEFDALNRRLRAAAEKVGAVATDRNGKKYYIGEWTIEDPYDRFVTLGAKRYAAEEGGHINVTISGVSKEPVKGPDGKDTDDTVAGLELGKLENLKDGFTFVKAGGVTAVYNDADDFLFEDPQTGKTVHITPNVAIVPKTYHLSLTDDYEELVRNCILWKSFCDTTGRIQK